MKYRYLLFDADNTLFDFDRCEFKAFTELERIIPDVFDKDSYAVYHKVNDSLWKKLEKGDISKEELKIERFRIFFEKTGVSVSEAKTKEIAKAFMNNLSECNFLLDNSYEVVKELSGKYVSYIITNGIEFIQKKRFISSPVNEYVKDIFVSDEIGYDKPDPLFFDAVIKSVGDSDLSSYLVIGDSLSSDIKGANAYGIDCIYLNRSGKSCSGYDVICEINKLDELLNILL